MTEGLPQGALGDLPGDGRGLLPGLARRRGDEGAQPAAHFDHAVLKKRPVRVLDRVRIQLELGRKLTCGWQRVPGLQDADGNRSLQFVGNLPVDGTRIIWPKLHEHEEQTSTLDN